MPSLPARPSLARALHALALFALIHVTSSCQAALSAPFTPPERGGAAWVEVTSPHFVLQSDLGASDARAAVEALERMYVTLLDVGFPYATKPTPRMRVIHFRREAEYKAVAPFGSGGFFTHAHLGGAGAEAVAVIYGDLTKRTRTVLQHELTHHFVRFYYPKAPTWLNEGLAHYFETLEADGGYAILGRPAFTFRRGTAWARGSVPTAAGVAAHDVVRTNKRDFDMAREKAKDEDGERAEARHATANRASAWALIHLLKNGPELYRTRFEAFLKELGKGARADAAWEKTFDVAEMDTLDKDLAASLAPAGREITLLRTAYTPPPPSIEGEREMPPAEVHLLWSVMRGRSGAAEVDAALALAPESPACWRAKARIQVSAGGYAEAEQSLQKARALGPNDPVTLFWLFRFYTDRAQARNALPIWRQRAEALIPALIPHASSSSTMTNSISWTLGTWGRVDEALPLALKSVELDASCWECYDTIAFLLAKQGAWAKAVEAQSLAVSMMPEYSSETTPFRALAEYKAALAKAEPQASGDLSAAVLRTIAKRGKDGYQRCYADGLGRDAKLGGKVAIRLVIERDGAVSSAKDEGSTLPDRAVVACVAAEIQKLRFPAREAGGAQSVLHAMTFSPEGPAQAP